MSVKVITETGEEIPLRGDLVNGGEAADAYVADQRQKLGLPVQPMTQAEADVFLAAKKLAEAEPKLDDAELLKVLPKAGK